MASGKVPRALPGTTSPRVAVAADQNLVAESVRAAMLHRGYDAVVVRWPADEEPTGARRLVADASRRGGRPAP